MEILLDLHAVLVWDGFQVAGIHIDLLCKRWILILSIFSIVGFLHLFSRFELSELLDLRLGLIRLVLSWVNFHLQCGEYWILRRIVTH